MKKIISFIKTWWRVAAEAFVLVLQLFSFGCAISTAEVHGFAGAAGILGAFIAIVACVVLIIETVNAIKRREKK